MNIIKLNFAGFTLDAIVGHPDHELLFVASQVNDAAGLSDKRLSAYISQGVVKGVRLASLVANLATSGQLKEPSGKKMRGSTWLISEPDVYKLLLRGHAPQSEPFRKWVTEEVLPSIRKTGQYDIAKSTSEVGTQLAEEFGKLRAEMQHLTAEVVSLKEVIAGFKALAASPAVKSPYEGTTKVAACDRIDSRQLREVAESMGLSAATAIKIAPRVAVRVELYLKRSWGVEMGTTPLEQSTSQKGRQWTLWPRNWIDTKMTRQMYREQIAGALEAAV